MSDNIPGALTGFTHSIRKTLNQHYGHAHVSHKKFWALGNSALFMLHPVSNKAKQGCPVSLRLPHRLSCCLVGTFLSFSRDLCLTQTAVWLLPSLHMVGISHFLSWMSNTDSSAHFRPDGSVIVNTGPWNRSTPRFLMCVRTHVCQSQRGYTICHVIKLQETQFS